MSVAVLADVARTLDGGVRRLTASEFVEEVLRRAILNGDLEGGTRLGLADVAGVLQVSTTPVREALRELSAHGLVRFDSYRGGTVHTLSRADMEEIVRLRQVLEPLAVREAVAGMTQEILGEAAAILSRMGDGIRWHEWVDHNREFHMALYAAAASHRLIAIIKGLQDTTAMYVSSTLRRHPGLRARADREHRELLDAMSDGHVERAIELTLAHLAIPLLEDG